MKTIIFSFDGTDNEPKDSDQDVDYKGAKEDDNITNVLKFHLLCGGNLKGTLLTPDAAASWPGVSQQTFYFTGVGTYGSRLRRLINKALAPERRDVATILYYAMEAFKNNYESGDKLLVTGFSRGAALARRFATLISRHLQNTGMAHKPFVYLAVWDTVASIGLPNLSKSERPKYDVVFEHGCTVSSIIIKALHMVSLDDKRKAFQPTLMNHEDRVTEVWFAGAHSDVGGGYYRDGLSDISLSFFRNWLEDQDIDVVTGIPSQEQLAQVLPQGVKYEISKDDVSINPNPFGKNHQQDRWPVIDWLTLTDRECCVIENNRISPEKRPIIFHSVPVRINGDGDYRPKSLYRKKHRVLYADGKLIECEGLIGHIEFAQRNLKALRKPVEGSLDSCEVTVFASEKYNHTGLMLEKGGHYDFEVSGNQTWKDGGVVCGPEGWDRGSVELGLKELPIGIAEPFRRLPDAKWFELCGCIGTDDDSAFRIGKKRTGYKVNNSGEFCPFANDLSTYYGNNSGKLLIKVTRVS